MARDVYVDSEGTVISPISTLKALRKVLTHNEIINFRRTRMLPSAANPSGHKPVVLVAAVNSNELLPTCVQLYVTNVSFHSRIQSVSR